MKKIQEFDRLLILYGSETGNSQDLAKIIAWQIASRNSKKLKLNFEIELMSCDEYPIKQFPEERLVLFICSTTGIGEEPLNMKRFWRFLLRRDLPGDSLSQLTFAVIGLGDSSYRKYNFVAKKLYKRLLSLGANSLLELALGDDQHDLGPFAKIDPWLKQFYELVLSTETDDDDQNDESQLIEPSFTVEFCTSLSSTINQTISKSQLSKPNQITDPLNPYEAKLVRNDRLTSDEHFQDVRLASLSIKSDDADQTVYNLGDVCVVYSQNIDQDVELFLSMFEPKIDSKQMIRIEPNRANCWIPRSSFYYHLVEQQHGQCSIQDLVKKYLDIRSIPKRSFFELFYRFSEDDLERDKLKRFASGDDLDELYDYVNRPKRSILEVMLDFRHTSPNVPFVYWFDLIPAISGRPYSIASSPLNSPTNIDLLYAVVNYRTRLREPRLGLCTNWLVNCPLSSKVSIFVRSSSFKLPESSSTRALIMISAGTGVAPFRAFIHDRAKRNLDQNYLFFGCRYSQSDYFLRDEWKPLIESGLLTVYPAFSRDNPDRKVYVQHLVWEQRALIYRLFTQQNATILVAGKSQQYPQLVRETIQDIFKDNLDPPLTNDDHDSGDQASEKYFEDLINKLELKKRIQFECW